MIIAILKKLKFLFKDNGNKIKLLILIEIQIFQNNLFELQNIQQEQLFKL